MNPNREMRYLIGYRDGRIWSFFSGEKNNIFYETSDRSHGQNGRVLVLSNARNEFGLFMDEFERLHLICLSLNNDIIYMHYDGVRWSVQELSKYDADKYAIRHPTVIRLGNQIHIILTIVDLLDTGRWSILHYRWDGLGWKGQKVLDLATDLDLDLFFYEMRGLDIHIFYGSGSGNRYKPLQIVYSQKSEKWQIIQGDHIKIDSPSSIHPNEQGSAGEYRPTEHLEEWIRKVEAAYRDHLAIAREADALYRRSMESKRQWELTLDELDHIKSDLSKLQKKGIFRKLFESILH